jgi:hypothetical protein
LINNKPPAELLGGIEYAFGRKIIDAIVAHAECGFEFLIGSN